MTITEIKVAIIQAAQQNGANPLLSLAVAKAESGFNQAAMSAVGAIGIFQLMPATAAELGVDPYDADGNIYGGTRYLSQMASHYPGRVDLQLAAYNWGMGNLNRAIWNSISFPPAANYPDPSQLLSIVPTETRNYITRISGYMIQLQDDPVYLASGASGELPPLTGGGSSSDVTLIAGVAALAILLVVLLRR